MLWGRVPVAGLFSLPEANPQRQRGCQLSHHFQDVALHT